MLSPLTQKHSKLDRIRNLSQIEITYSLRISNFYFEEKTPFLFLRDRKKASEIFFRSRNWLDSFKTQSILTFVRVLYYNCDYNDSAERSDDSDDEKWDEKNKNWIEIVCVAYVKKKIHFEYVRNKSIVW